MLQDNGGELEISQINRLLPSYMDITEDEINYSEISKKGNKYTPFLIGRNFAIVNLKIAGFITPHLRTEPIMLTQEGLSVDIDNLDLERDVFAKTESYWQKKKEERRQKHLQGLSSQEGISDEDYLAEDTEAEAGDQDYKSMILDKVKTLNPIKFEKFARGLLQKMGFEVDPVKGIVASGDGGIDGFAYCTDEQNLRSTRVAIQCKRYTNGSVGSPAVRDLKGAIDSYRADYGVLITTSYFSKDAIEEARNKGTPVTLIDGEQLVDLNGALLIGQSLHGLNRVWASATIFAMPVNRFCSQRAARPR